MFTEQTKKIFMNVNKNAMKYRKSQGLVMKHYERLFAYHELYIYIYI